VNAIRGNTQLSLARSLPTSRLEPSPGEVREAGGKCDRQVERAHLQQQQQNEGTSSQQQQRAELADLQRGHEHAITEARKNAAEELAVLELDVCSQHARALSLRSMEQEAEMRELRAKHADAMNDAVEQAGKDRAAKKEELDREAAAKARKLQEDNAQLETVRLRRWMQAIQSMLMKF
jgi:hypothetical protein